MAHLDTLSPSRACLPTLGIGCLLAIAISSGWALAGDAAARAETAKGPACVASRPALATTGKLLRTSQRLRAGGVLRILAIGSSSTAGTGASSPAAAYPARLADEIDQQLPSIEVEVTAAGVAGETASQTLDRLMRQVEMQKPDLVIWQVGTNDALAEVSEDNFRTLVERGVAAVDRVGADLILLDQQFFPTIRKRDRYERFVAIVREVGLSKRACVFNRYALMKAWAERPEDTLKAMLASDGFHMSDRGHACMARILADEIVKAALRPIETALN